MYQFINSFLQFNKAILYFKINPTILVDPSVLNLQIWNAVLTDLLRHCSYVVLLYCYISEHFIIAEDGDSHLVQHHSGKRYDGFLHSRSQILLNLLFSFTVIFVIYSLSKVALIHNIQIAQIAVLAS